MYYCKLPWRHVSFDATGHGAVWPGSGKLSFTGLLTLITTEFKLAIVARTKDVHI